MDYLGLFCLGVFAGTIATFGMTHVNSLEEWKTVLAFALPAVLGGAAMVLVDRFADSPAFGSYPAGLVAALVWAFAPDSIKLIKSNEKSAVAIGRLHLGAAALTTVILAVFTTVPAFLQIRAEWRIPDEPRWVILLERHLNAGKPAATPAQENKAAQRPVAGK